MSAVQQQTLEGFLLARVAEDEAAARGVADRYPGVCWPYDALDERPLSYQHVETFLGVTCNPPRVLAECEAKRQIIELERLSGEDVVYEVLQLLALPYSDHPDYRDEWQPRD